MKSADTYTYSVRLLPPLITALSFTVMMSSPLCEFSMGEIVVFGLRQLAVSYRSLWGDAHLCRRVCRRKWLTIFSPLALLLIPLPMYGVLYGIAEWSEWSLLLFVGGDGVFNFISWGLQLALFAYGMVFSGNVLLKKAPPFPQSQAVSLLSALGGLIFGSIFFLPGICATFTEGRWLKLLLPPALLFLLPPIVFILVFEGNLPRSTGRPQ